MAGGAAKGGVDLAGADEGRRRRGDVVVVTADAVKALVAILVKGVLGHRVGMAVVMAAEVGGMATEARAAIAIVVPGVTVVVGPVDAGTVGGGVAHEAVVLVDGLHHLTQMAGNAKGRGGVLYTVVMTMARVVGRQDLGLGQGEVVYPVTADTR